MCEEVKFGCIVDFDNHLQNVFFSGFIILEIFHILSFSWYVYCKPEFMEYVKINENRTLQVFIHALVFVFFPVFICIYEADLVARKSKKEIVDIFPFQNREINSSNLNVRISDELL